MFSLDCDVGARRMMIGMSSRIDRGWCSKSDLPQREREPDGRYDRQMRRPVRLSRPASVGRTNPPKD